MPYTLFKNKKIFYRSEGEGSPVILLHGFGEDGNIWNRQINALKENNLLIIPDLPGSGNSEMLEGSPSLEDYAEVIKTVADEIILKEYSQFCLIGHSMGGYITLAFAEKYHKVLNSFGLFHSSAFADSEEKKGVRKKGINFIVKNGSAAFLKASIPDLFSEKTKKENPELLTRLFNIAKNISPQALIQYYEAMIKRPGRISVLQSFKKPVLFISGEHDSVVPLSITLEQCHIPAISVIHVLENSAHEGMWEEEKTANIFLKDFLINQAGNQ